MCPRVQLEFPSTLMRRMICHLILNIHGNISFGVKSLALIVESRVSAQRVQKRTNQVIYNSITRCGTYECHKYEEHGC